jgi:hypothetical protein
MLLRINEIKELSNTLGGMQINTSKREICRWFLKKLNVNDPAIPVYA